MLGGRAGACAWACTWACAWACARDMLRGRVDVGLGGGGGPCSEGGGGRAADAMALSWCVSGAGLETFTRAKSCASAVVWSGGG